MKKINQELKDAFQKNEEPCGHVITLFQLLSNKTRFRIVCLLARGEFCVNEIVRAVCAGKLSNVSQQLKILALAGVVERRRQDRKILYSLKDRRVRNTVQFLRKQFLNGEEQ